MRIFAECTETSEWPFQSRIIIENQFDNLSEISAIPFVDVEFFETVKRDTRRQLTH